MVTLHTKKLCKRFGPRTVFKGLSFTHSKGVLGIAGANGAGKSTLMQCLAGLLSVSDGQISWKKGSETISQVHIKLQLGFVAPYINLYPELSCRENLDFLLKLRNYTNRAEAVEATLKRTEAISFSDQLFGSLSTGQQQRIRLAGGLVHQPDILFLDEPGSNLDEKGISLVRQLVNQFKEAHKMVIVASNDPSELAVADALYSVEKADFI